jgi:CRP-like cAMP-binding protein
MFEALFNRLRQRLLRQQDAVDSSFWGSASDTELPSAERAAQMLRSPKALMTLSETQARAVVRRMHPQLIDVGTVILQQGDLSETDFLLLILCGEVTVETLNADRRTTETQTVLGPGTIIGEMALFDGGARSATCTATAPVRCAVLTREALHNLTQQDPTTAARLLAALAQRLATRLRQSDERIQIYHKLVRTLQQEIDVLMR